MMKKTILGFGFSAIAALAMVVGPDTVSARPSSKVTPSQDKISLENPQDLKHGEKPSDILTTQFNKAHEKDLGILVSVECGHFTEPEMERHEEDGSSFGVMSASMRLRIEDSNGKVKYAHPKGDSGKSENTEGAPGMVSCLKSQTLEASVIGFVKEDSLVLVNSDGLTHGEFIGSGGDPSDWSPLDVIIEETLVEEEEINPMSGTMHAYTFNFTSQSLPSGDYTLTVEAHAHSDTTSEGGSVNAGFSGGDTTLVAGNLPIRNSVKVLD